MMPAQVGCILQGLRDLMVGAGPHLKHLAIQTPVDCRLHRVPSLPALIHQYAGAQLKCIAEQVRQCTCKPPGQCPSCLVGEVALRSQDVLTVSHHAGHLYQRPKLFVSSCHYVMTRKRRKQLKQPVLPGKGPCRIQQDSGRRRIGHYPPNLRHVTEHNVEHNLQSCFWYSGDVVNHSLHSAWCTVHQNIASAFVDVVSPLIIIVAALDGTKEHVGLHNVPG